MPAAAVENGCGAYDKVEEDGLHIACRISKRSGPVSGQSDIHAGDPVILFRQAPSVCKTHGFIYADRYDECSDELTDKK